MTLDSRSLLFDSRTDLDFRAWGAGLNAALAASGLVQTADTGQINWGTVTRTFTPVNTTGTAHVQGYEIWRFNDALQATKPVIIKLEYGYNTVANTNYATAGYAWPVIYITVGTGTNGAGSFTGTLVTTRVPLSAYNYTYQNYGGNSSTANSGAVNEVSPVITVGDLSSAMQCIGATANRQATQNMWGSAFGYAPFPIIWGVERIRDSNGAPTGDGVVLMTYRWNGTGAWSSQLNTLGATTTYQTINFTGTGSVATAANYWPLPFLGVGFNTAATAAEVAFFPMPTSVPGRISQSLMFLGTYKTDLPFGTLVDLQVMGTTRRYISLVNMGGDAANDQARGQNLHNVALNGGVLMRYE